MIYHFRGNKEFPRLRIGEFVTENTWLFGSLSVGFFFLIILTISLGIGRPPGQMDPKAFLLQRFNATAQERVSLWFLLIISGNYLFLL